MGQPSFLWSGSHRRFWWTTAVADFVIDSARTGSPAMNAVFAVN